jgi:hypothetical protein
MVENERHAGHACMMPLRVGMPSRMDVSWRRSEQRTVENERHAAGMMPPRVGMPRMMENERHAGYDADATICWSWNAAARIC